MAACRSLLATHPQVQEKLAAELKAAGLLATKGQPEGRRMTYADLWRLPYLDAVHCCHCQTGVGSSGIGGSLISFSVTEQIIHFIF